MLIYRLRVLETKYAILCSKWNYFYHLVDGSRYGISEISMIAQLTLLEDGWAFHKFVYFKYFVKVLHILWVYSLREEIRLRFSKQKNKQKKTSHSNVRCMIKYFIDFFIFIVSDILIIFFHVTLHRRHMYLPKNVLYYALHQEYYRISLKFLEKTISVQCIRCI